MSAAFARGHAGLFSRPRYRTYAVVDAHTGAVLSVHASRKAAENAVTAHSHRVRGVRP